MKDENKARQIFDLNSELDELKLSNDYYNEKIEANESRMNKIQSELQNLDD